MSRRVRQRRRQRHRRSPFRSVFAVGGVLTLCAAAVGALAIAGWVINVAHSAPNLSSVHPTTPGSPSEVFAADGTPMGEIYTPEVHTEVTGSQITRMLKEATVAVEDRRFYEHGALDYQGILRAAIKDVINGHNALQGASTLTMQLVDNVYLPKKYQGARADHDLRYKIVQAKLAEQLESKHSKDWILDRYLNSVPYGTVRSQTAYGVGAASEMFFDRPVGKLDLEQVALLAGLPQAPSQYNPFIDPRAARVRRAHVLATMVRAHDITRHRAAVANRKPLEVKPDTLASRHIDPYVFDYVEQAVAADLCPATPKHCPALIHGGLKIDTTIDLHKQAEATAAIADHASLLAEDGGPGVGAGLASVDTATGDIEAIATSGSYAATKVDYATSASRQTGSAFKVFALMELIHDFHGNPNGTYYASRPLPAGWLAADPTWSVHTDDNAYHGTISVGEATAISDNTVFAQLTADMGNTAYGDKLDQLAHAMGITSPLDGNASEVLGGLTRGTTPLQMADAYATIANGGTHHDTTIIDKVSFPDGSTRDFGEPGGDQIFPYAETYAADQVLEKVLTQAGATGTEAEYGCPAAGKTGTAENLENAWFVGYTPRTSTAVWVGNPTDNVPMGSDAFGGVLAAPIWKQYMEDTAGGYCGNWTEPTTPYEGTAFSGHFADQAGVPRSRTYGPSTASSPSTPGSTGPNAPKTGAPAPSPGSATVGGSGTTPGVGGTTAVGAGSTGGTTAGAGGTTQGANGTTGGTGGATQGAAGTTSGTGGGTSRAGGAGLGGGH